MVELTDHAGLVGEHGGDARVPPVLGREDLDHHTPAEGARSFELGEPDFTHAPETQSLLQDVSAADAFACLHSAPCHTPTGTYCTAAPRQSLGPGRRRRLRACARG